MDERARLRALRQCRSLRLAERAHAEGTLLEARAREGEAIAAGERAEAEVLRAAGAWQQHLRSVHFDPAIAGGLAGLLNAGVTVAGDARAEAARTGDVRERCETAWRDGDARCRQLDALVRMSRRAILREREERALERLEDRVTFIWSRRL